MTQNDRFLTTLMPMDTAPALATLYARLLSLKLLPRTGWLQRGVAQPESIAEHTFGVAALAMLLGGTLPYLDQGKLLSIALLHDIAETLISDLPASTQPYLPKHTKHAAERQALCDMLSDLPNCDALVALWDEYTTRSSPEARLVKGLDRIEMLSQALAYEQAGNRALAEFWRDAEDGWSDEFPVLRDMANTLLQQRRHLHQML